MKELTEYRINLMNKLAAAANEFRAACISLKDPHAPIADGWNAHQIAAHTRDVDKLVYGLRARRTIAEDDPEFANFDGNTYMAENYESKESLNEMLNGFVESVESLAETLRALPPEAWSRESRHVTLGSGFTLQTWVERGLAHIEEHLATVRNSSAR